MKNLGHEKVSGEIFYQNSLAPALENPRSKRPEDISNRSICCLVPILEKVRKNLEIRTYQNVYLRGDLRYLKSKRPGLASFA